MNSKTKKDDSKLKVGLEPTTNGIELQYYKKPDPNVYLGQFFSLTRPYTDTILTTRNDTHRLNKHSPTHEGSNLVSELNESKNYQNR